MAQIVKDNEQAAKAVAAARAAMTGKGAENVTVSFERNAAALRKIADEARKVTGALDPVSRATATLAQQQEKLNQLYEAGALSQEDFGRYSGIVNERLAKLGGVAGGTAEKVKLTGSQVQNLGYQMNDVATMLAMGASPFQVITSQAGQVVQALGDGPGGVRGSLRAMADTAKAGALAAASALGPVGLGLAAVTAGAGLFALAMRKSVPDATETLKKHSEILAKVAAQYDGVAEVLDQIGKRNTIGLSIELDKNGRDIAESLKAQVKEVERQFGGTAGLLAGRWGGFSAGPMLTKSEFAPIANEVDRLRAKFREANPDVAALSQEIVAFMTSLEAANKVAGDDSEMKKAIEAAKNLVQPLLAAATAFEQNAAAASGAALALAKYGAAMDGLAGFVPDLRTDAEQINAFFNAAIATAADATAKFNALAQRNAAMDALTGRAQGVLGEARAANSAVGLGKEAQAVAEVNAKYAALEAQNKGNADALLALNAARQVELDTIGKQTRYDEAQERQKVSDQRQKQADREIESARAATVARMAGYSQTIDAMRAEISAYGMSEGAARAYTTEVQLLAAAKQAAGAAGIVSDAEIAKIRETSAEIGRLTDQIAARTAADSAVDQFFPFQAAQREAERLNGYITDTTNGLSDLQRQALSLQIDQSFTDAAEAAEQLRTRGVKAGEDIGQSFLENVGDVFADIFSQGVRDGESFFSSILRGFAGLGKQLAGAGGKNLLSGLFGLPQDKSAAGIGGLIGNAGSAIGSMSGGRSGFSYASSYAPTSQPIVAKVDVASASGAMMQYAGRFNSSVDSRLLKILNEASSRFDMRVEAISGLRPGDKRFHGKGLATDVQIYGANGKALGNYQDAATFRTYERFAQLSKQVQSELFPELEGMLRWGGYFSGGKGKYGALDTMHFDLAGNRVGMGGGSWDGGLTPAMRRIWGGAQSVGMGSASADQRTVAKGVEQGLTNYTRASPAAQSAVSGGFDGFSHNGTGGQQLTGLQKGFGAIGAGLGIFGAGYDSGSPLSGGLSGALGGWQAGAALGVGGPIGAIAGLGLGILGGIFGGRAKRKAEHQAAAAEWAKMRPQYEQFDRSLSGEGIGGLRTMIGNDWAQLSAFMETGGKAWKMGKGNSSAQFASTGTKMFAKFQEAKDDFLEAFPEMLEDLTAGDGLEGEFVKARTKVRGLRDTIRNFVDDVKVAFMDADIGIPTSPEYEAEAKAWEEKRNAAVAEAKKAAGEYALTLLYQADNMSAVTKALDSFNGTAAGLKNVLIELGWTADQAAVDIQEKLTAALGDMRKTFEQDIADQISDLKGEGYFAEVRAFLAEFDTIKSDAGKLGADTSNLDELFSLKLQSIVDGAELTGDAFDQLIAAFPQLAGAVKSFAETSTASTKQIQEAYQGFLEGRLSEATSKRADAENALRAAYERSSSFIRTVQDYLNDLNLDTNLSTLSNKEQFEEAQRLYRETLFKAGGGDTEAQDALTGAAQAYAEAAKGRFGDDERYGAVVSELQSTLKGSIAKAQTALDYAKQEAKFLADIAEGTKSMSALLKEYLDALQKEKDTQKLVDGNRSFGLNPTRNRSIDAAIKQVGLSYTGNYGIVNGADPFLNWRSALPPEQRAVVEGIINQFIGMNYDTGGYTGPGGRRQPAGVVHKGEVVFSQDNVAAWGGPANVEAIRLGRVAPVTMPSMERAIGAGAREAADRASQAEIASLRGDVAGLTVAIEGMASLLAGKLDQGNRATRNLARPLGRVASRL
ncbi:phage tail length tape measure family protein [Aureimonas sp. AU4]|uniref:phage tail length tape measure family protein n=1 Tax=Aureimonas sp. AU4 TaxID=1638163 RepID=UPI000785FB26|nr:phage tail length tape measure family protein [Aureimonas sp. AU4]